MRILHMIARFHPARGGAETYLLELSTRLAAAGHDVTVVTTDAFDVELLRSRGHRRIHLPEMSYQGVKILYFPVRHLPAVRVAYPALRLLANALATLPGGMGAAHLLSQYTPYVPELWRWAETTRERFDLIAAMGLTFESVVRCAGRLARRLHTPLVVYPLIHLGAGPAPAADRFSRFYTMRHQIDLVRQADHVAATTATARRYFESRGVPAERLSVVGPGIDPQSLAGGNGRRWRAAQKIDAPLILYLGAVGRDKGAVDLVEAVRRLWAAGEQVELVLAGTILSPFRTFLAGLPQADRGRLRLLGPVDEQEKKDLLDAADIFCLPSRTESFGIVYLEAWFYGKPVVAAQTWGIRGDLVQEEQDGLLVPFGDSAALAETLRRLLHNPALAAALGRAGRAKVLREHTWELKYAAVREIYAALAGEESGVS